MPKIGAVARQLNVLFKLRPVLHDRALAAATEIDVAVLIGHGVRVVHHPGNLHRVVVLAHLFERRAVDHDHHLAGFAVRSPDPVVIVTADGEGQATARAKKVDGASFAIVRAEDACARAVRRRKRVVDARHIVDHLAPAEAVGIELRKGAGCLVLHVLGCAP